MTNLTPLILDFETYYSKEYSLKLMPTMQYIRDPRFRVEGVSLARPGSPAKWVPAEHVESVLRRLPWESTLLVCHNSTFDGAILSERYNLRPAQHFCTMFAARYLISQNLLDAEQGTSLKDLAPLVGMEKGNIETDDLGTYGVQDSNITAALFAKFHPQVPEMERELIDLHVRMATEPTLALNIPLLERMASADKALEKLFPLVRKDETFAALLVKLGVQPEYKSTKTGRMKLALAKTDTFMQSLANHADPKVRQLHEVRAKASSTIERTRSQRFIDVGSPLPVPQVYYGAHTGRGSGDDNLNLQNLKKSGDLRRAIIAPPGHLLCVGDSAQIEVRVLAYMASEESLLERFRNGEDVYRAFASERLYGVPMDQVTGDQRQIAKAAVLALGFGQGAGGFYNYCTRFGIVIDPAECERVVQVYRRAHRRIGDFWRDRERFVKTHGYQELPSGRRLYYPALRIGAEGLEYRRARIFRKVLSEGYSNVWHGLLTENCLAADTQVLTSTGWEYITNITSQHLLWDGEEWVRSSGCIYKGEKPVRSLHGLRLTADHQIFDGSSWRTAIASDAFFIRRALKWAASSVPEWCAGLTPRTPRRDALSAGGSGEWYFVTSTETAGQTARARSKETPSGEIISRLQSFTHYGLTAIRVLFLGVPILLAQRTPIMAGGALLFTNRGLKTARSFSVMQRRSKVGMTSTSTSTASTIAGGTSPATCGYARAVITPATSGALLLYITRGTSYLSALLRSSLHRFGRAVRCSITTLISGPLSTCWNGTESIISVYDVVNAGPRNRFTVLTDKGPLVVHNCVQAAARDVVFAQALRLKRQGYRVANLVHDEIICVVPEDKADECKRAMEVSLSASPTFMRGLPTKGEVKLMTEYSK